MSNDNEIGNSARVHAGLRVDIYRLEAGLYKEGGVGRAQGEKPDSNSNTTLTELEFGSNTTNKCNQIEIGKYTDQANLSTLSRNTRQSRLHTQMRDVLIKQGAMT
jgi:hypothetical protein